MIVQMSPDEGFETFFQHVQFEITGRCNIRCPHCRAFGESKIDLPIATMSNVLEFVSRESDEGFNVTLSGGEPFLRDDLVEVVTLAASFNPKLIAITTNGLVCDEIKMQKIAENKGISDLGVQVSIDAPNAKEHDEFRDHEHSFDKAVATIKMAQKFGLRTSIRSTMSRHSVHRIEDLVILAESLHVPSISFGTVVPFGNAKINAMSVTAEQKRDFIIEIARLKKQHASTILIDTEDPLRLAANCNDVWDIGDLDPDDELTFGGCTAGITTFNVSSNGDITPCAVLSCVILNATGKNAEEMKIAYADSEVIKQLFSRSFNGKCGSCKLRRVCGGCRSIPHSLYGDLMGTDPTCWL